MLKCADWIIDMGPTVGRDGGYIVAEGCPNIIINQKNSMTGKFLKSLL